MILAYITLKFNRNEIIIFIISHGDKPDAGF